MGLLFAEYFLTCCQVHNCTYHLCSTLVLKIVVTSGHWRKLHEEACCFTWSHGCFCCCCFFASSSPSSRNGWRCFSCCSSKRSWLGILQNQRQRPRPKPRWKQNLLSRLRQQVKQRLLPAKLLGLLRRQRQKSRSWKNQLQLYLLVLPRRKPRPKQRLSRKWQKDGRRSGMRKFAMSMQKEKKRSPKNRMNQLMMSFEAIPRRGNGPDWSRVARCQRIFSSSTNKAPRILLTQGCSRASSSTRYFSRTPKENTCLPLEMPSSKFSRRILRFAATNLRLLGCLTPSCCGKDFHENEQALNDAERRGDVYQKDGYYHFKTVATAIEKKQDTSMVLHGGKGDLTKDEYSQMNQFMSGRPWSQFGIGGSPSSTPAVVTQSSSSLPKAICDAPVKHSWSSVEHDIKEAKGAQERLGRDCQRLAAKIFDKKDECVNKTLKTVLNGLSQRESMLGQGIIFQTVEGTDMEKTKVEKFFHDLGQATEDAKSFWNPPSQ